MERIGLTWQFEKEHDHLAQPATLQLFLSVLLRTRTPQAFIEKTGQGRCGVVSGGLVCLARHRSRIKLSPTSPHLSLACEQSIGST
jgi:hypothetical protein